jgi:sugar (pentulose or hexulose) kinase
MARLLGIDIGTTHCKAGLFEHYGSSVKVATRETITHFDSNGHASYKPDELWSIVASAIKEATEGNKEELAVIGITSMAEAGLLINRKSGEPKTDFIPWFDKRTQPQAEQMKEAADPFERFTKTGLGNSYKYGLPKLMWLDKEDPGITKGAVWLSTSDYIAYKLTGKFGTDYSLAARTYAFRIDTKEWDTPWIRQFGFDNSLFPEARPSGSPLGEVHSSDLEEIGISKGTPVAVSGHDHVCAALAVGAVNPGVVFDSIGTAETLVGTLNERTLGRKEYSSGLSYGCHVAKNRYFWMGGSPSSGGSVEWIRNQLSDQPLSYEEIQRLLAQTKQGPTGILFYPYLSGSGAPNPDPHAKGAFIGLSKTDKREDLVKALLEGTAYQMESIRRSAEEIAGSPITKMIAVGGGTRNSQWMQIKADVSNCEFQIPDIPEATMLGAAIAAGIGCGLYRDEEEAVSLIENINKRKMTPNDGHHHLYQNIYENGYVRLQEPLRTYYQNPLGDE